MVTKKSTHTIQDIEGLMFDYVGKIKDSETKEEKKALLKKLKMLEKHYNSTIDKDTNGKQYPARMYHSGPDPMNKEEIYKLIDLVKDVEAIPYEIDKELRT